MFQTDEDKEAAEKITDTLEKKEEVTCLLDNKDYKRTPSEDAGFQCRQNWLLYSTYS